MTLSESAALIREMGLTATGLAQLLLEAADIKTKKGTAIALLASMIIKRAIEHGNSDEFQMLEAELEKILEVVTSTAEAKRILKAQSVYQLAESDRTNPLRIGKENMAQDSAIDWSLNGKIARALETRVPAEHLEAAVGFAKEAVEALIDGKPVSEVPGKMSVALFTLLQVRMVHVALGEDSEPFLDEAAALARLIMKTGVVSALGMYVNDGDKPS